MDTLEDNKALIQKAYEEIWSKGNLDAIEDIISADCEAYSPQNPDEPVGAGMAREEVAAARKAFPDLTRTAEEMVAEGNKMVARSRIKGTHLGEFRGMPPTGREVEFYAITIYGIEEGKIAYEWTMTDSLGLMQQLGG